MNSCFAIIAHNEKVLLFLRDDKPDIPYPNHWHLPGGGRDEGETPRQAIERELKEEITHILRKLQLLGSFIKDSGFETHIFTAFVSNQEAKLFKLGQGEGQELRFFSVNQLKRLNLTPGISKYLTNYENLLVKSLKNKSFDELVSYL